MYTHLSMMGVRLDRSLKIRPLHCLLTGAAIGEELGIKLKNVELLEDFANPPGLIRGANSQ